MACRTAVLSSQGSLACVRRAGDDGDGRGPHGHSSDGRTKERTAAEGPCGRGGGRGAEGADGSKTTRAESLSRACGQPAPASRAARRPWWHGWAACYSWRCAQSHRRARGSRCAKTAKPHASDGLAASGAAREAGHVVAPQRRLPFGGASTLARIQGRNAGRPAPRKGVSRTSASRATCRPSPAGCVCMPKRVADCDDWRSDVATDGAETHRPARTHLGGSEALHHTPSALPCALDRPMAPEPDMMRT
jgi:hypothetical protein